MRLLRSLQFAKYKNKDTKEYLSKSLIEIHLERDLRCKMERIRCGSHKVKIHHLPIFNNHCYLILRRHKGWYSNCKAVPSEKVDFISEGSPQKSVGTSTRSTSKILKLNTFEYTYKCRRPCDYHGILSG